MEINKKIVNATSIFILAYLVVHLCYIFIVYFCAKFIGMEHVKAYFTYVSFDFTDFNNWSRVKIFILYGIPTFSMIVLAFLAWIVQNKVEYGQSPLFILFGMSISIFAIAFFIADFIVSPFYRQGIAIVEEWFYLKREAVLAISFIAWAFIPITARVGAKYYLQLANSRRFIRSKWARLSFIINNIVLPFCITGIILSVLILLTPAYELDFFIRTDLVRILVIALLFFFVAGFNFHKNYIKIKKTHEMDSWQISLLVFTFVSVGVIYISLIF